ncbi:hypothetical protein [Nostoc sp.]|uniref:hypothetical protein n=1 Tax=Nostoc sp. TaxID=1180 RepID=UPI002FFA76CC
MQLSLRCALPSIQTQRQQNRYAFGRAMSTDRLHLRKDCLSFRCCSVPLLTAKRICVPSLHI